jgi:hypothetical protein
MTTEAELAKATERLKVLSAAAEGSPWKTLRVTIGSLIEFVEEAIANGRRLDPPVGDEWPGVVDALPEAGDDQHQMQEGSNGLYPEGQGGVTTQRVGRIYVTPVGATTWQEDWIVLDADAFPDLTDIFDLAFDGNTTQTGDDYIDSLPAGTPFTRATVQFKYKSMPGEAQIANLPSGLTGTTYRVVSVKNPTGTPVPFVSGRLFRRYLGTNGANLKYEDHWVLKQNYEMPQNGSPGYHTRQSPVTAGFADLKAFLREYPMPSGWVTSTAPDTTYVFYAFEVSSGTAP